MPINAKAAQIVSVPMLQILVAIEMDAADDTGIKEERRIVKIPSLIPNPAGAMKLRVPITQDRE